MSITNKSSIEVWSNAIPNSHFQIRPVALIAMKESEENVSSVDKEQFLALPSTQRFGLTHEPLSNIDVISASPLHSYEVCVPLVYDLSLPPAIWFYQMVTNIT